MTGGILVTMSQLSNGYGILPVTDKERLQKKMEMFEEEVPVVSKHVNTTFAGLTNFVYYSTELTNRNSLSKTLTDNWM